MIQQKQRKNFTCLLPVTFALLSCWCISSKFFLSVTRLDITQKLPSASGSFLSREAFFFGFSVIPPKSEEGFLLMCGRYRLVSFLNMTPPKSIAWTPHQLGWRWSREVFLLKYKWSVGFLCFFKNRNGRPMRKWSSPKCSSDLFFPVNWLSFVQSGFKCCEWWSFCHLFWTLLHCLENPALTGYSQVVFSLISCQCILLRPSACCPLIF